MTDMIFRSLEVSAGMVQLSLPGLNRRLKKITDFQKFFKLILLMNSLKSSLQNLNLAPRFFQILFPHFNPGSWLARMSRSTLNLLQPSSKEQSLPSQTQRPGP